GASHTPDPGPPEVDTFQTSRAQVVLQDPSGAQHTIVLNGPTTVNVWLGQLGDVDGDGLEEVPTEMVNLNLTGDTPQGPVAIRLRDPSLSPMRKTLGEIEETAN